MPSKHEAFWRHDSYAVVGDSEHAQFPRLTYDALKRRPGVTVFAVDPNRQEIDGDPAFPDLAALPQPVQAVVLEVPKQRTADWVRRAVDAGITDVWIHMKRDTPEALAIAEEHGLGVCTGTCAVQYLTGGFPHNLHRVLRKIAGRW